MAEDEEDDFPEHVKKLQKGGPIKPRDNFGIEDMGLEGLKDFFDFGEVMKDRGFHEYEPIKLLAFALLAANQKELSVDQLSPMADQIVRLIIGKDGRGNKEVDDDWPVQIVAKCVFRKLYGYE